MITAAEVQALVTKWHDGRARRAEEFFTKDMLHVESAIREKATEGCSVFLFPTIHEEAAEKIAAALREVNFTVEIKASAYGSQHRCLHVEVKP
jgi:hypothetical protein